MPLSRHVNVAKRGPFVHKPVQTLLLYRYHSWTTYAIAIIVRQCGLPSYDFMFDYSPTLIQLNSSPPLREFCLARVERPDCRACPLAFVPRAATALIFMSLARASLKRAHLPPSLRQPSDRTKAVLPRNWNREAASYADAMLIIVIVELSHYTT